jgi:hypothetical protein
MNFINSVKGVFFDMVPANDSSSAQSSSSTWSDGKGREQDSGEKRSEKWRWESLAACLNLTQCLMACFGMQ